MISENFLDRDYQRDLELIKKRNGRIMEDLTYNHKISYDYKNNKFKKERDGYRIDNMREDYLSLRNKEISRDKYILNKLNLYYEGYKFYENPLRYSRLISLSLRINEFYKDLSLYKFLNKIDLLFKFGNIDKIIDIKDYLK
jgi:hypothetical protein